MGKHKTSLDTAALFAQIGEPRNTAARRTAAAHALRQQPYAAVSDGLKALAAAPSARVRAAAALILGGLQTDCRDERQQVAALLCRLLRRGETPAVRAAAVAALAERCRSGTFGEEEFALIEPHLAPCFFADRPAVVRALADAAADFPASPRNVRFLAETVARAAPAAAKAAAAACRKHGLADAELTRAVEGRLAQSDTPPALRRELLACLGGH